MLRYLTFASLLLFSKFIFADDILSPSAKFEQFNENDKQIINQFCMEYKSNLKKSFDLVNNANVSPSTFALFITNARTNIVPTNVEFLKEFEARGADSCSSF
jgi:hypothetical protein